jgi:oligopeptide/dipeptide ABC transporter ATP-binding protein
MTGPLLRVENLTKTFARGGGLWRKAVAVRAVDGVSFEIGRGETLGLVGESGCGKTTTGRLILRLIEPSGGNVRLDGRDVLALRGHELRAARRDMQIVFQDPYGSLNPRMSVGELIAEPLVIHGVGTPIERERRMRELLDQVGLASFHAARFPHEFSGGQRQRVCIARALALAPRFLVCDEAVSALDVSIQAQIVNLLQDLKAALGLTYLFISHDLGVIRHISDRVAVMYLGKVVELAPRRSLFAAPRHPYTQALLRSVPTARGGKRRYETIKGDVPSPLAPPSGCRFNTRCPQATDLCRRVEPPLLSIDASHLAACHFVAPTSSRREETPAS